MDNKFLLNTQVSNKFDTLIDGFEKYFEMIKISFDEILTYDIVSNTDFIKESMLMVSETLNIMIIALETSQKHQQLLSSNQLERMMKIRNNTLNLKDRTKIFII